MLSVGSAILLGAALLLAFAFLKLVSDIRCKAIASSRQIFDEHFDHVNKFIQDPASPIEASNLLVKFSTYAVKESAGKKALEVVVSEATSKKNQFTPPTQSMIDISRSLDELARHRPDLSEAFCRAVSCGFLGAAYGEIAREMSPLRAFRESKEAKQAKRTNRSAESMARALGAFLDPASPSHA